MTTSPTPKRRMSKLKKIILWVVGAFVGLTVLGGILNIADPEGMEEIRAEQESVRVEKAEQKEADKAEKAAQEAAKASQEAERSETEAKAVADEEAAQAKAQEAEDAQAEKDRAAADKESKADAKQQKIDAANKWWFDDNGSLLTQHIKALEGFTDAAVSEDLGGMVTNCAAMQEQTKFMGQRSIDTVSRPTAFGDDVADRFDSASSAFRDAAKGCKAVLDGGELTRADRTGQDVASAHYGFQSVKDSIYGEYVEIK